MPIEDKVTYVNDLVPAWPESGDPKSKGDDHIRNLKTVFRNSFPNFTGPMLIANDQLVSKTELAQAQFQSALPAAPADTLPYRLIITAGVAGWQLDSTFSSDARLAEAHAVALSF